MFNMVFAAISFALGILLAIVILAVTRRGKPAAPGWWCFGFGLTAAIAFALTIWWPINSNAAGLGLNLISIAFAFAAVTLGVGNLIRRDRHWPTWVGMIAGLMPALFWIAFTAVNIFRFGQ